eukprot:6480485-Alexandrium_andersonii.AAC.1
MVQQREAVGLAPEHPEVEDAILRRLWRVLHRSLLARGLEAELPEGREVLRAEDVEVHELLPLK